MAKKEVVGTGQLQLSIPVEYGSKKNSPKKGTSKISKNEED
jgi:hypothetical protein